MRATVLSSLCLIALCGCEHRAAPSRLRVVHVAWPGRPVSDTMDREVFADPRLTAALARFDFVRTTVDDAPAEVREVLRGMGTIVLDSNVPVAVRSGASSARQLIGFLDRVRRALADRGSAVDGAPPRPLDRARMLVESGLPRAALDALELATDGSDSHDALPIRIDALLALGDVATARCCLDLATGDAVPPLTRARVLIDERRSRDAIDVLRSVDPANFDAGCAYWLGRALLDCEQRREAYALLEPLAVGDGPFADDAAEILDSAIAGRTGHSHR